MRHFLVGKILRNHSDRLPAAGENGIRNDAHQADMRSAVDQSEIRTRPWLCPIPTQ